MEQLLLLISTIAAAASAWAAYQAVQLTVVSAREAHEAGAPNVAPKAPGFHKEPIGAFRLVIPFENLGARTVFDVEFHLIAMVEARGLGPPRTLIDKQFKPVGMRLEPNGGGTNIPLDVQMPQRMPPTHFFIGIKGHEKDARKVLTYGHFMFWAGISKDVFDPNLSWGTEEGRELLLRHYRHSIAPFIV